MMHWDGNDWSWGWPGLVFMVLTMVAFWGLIAWVVVALLRRGGAGEARPDDPERTLADQFARGEIDEDEYRHRLDVLRGTRTRG